MPGRFWSSSALALLRSTRPFFAGAFVSDLAGASFAGAAFVCAHTAGLPSMPAANASVTSRAINRIISPSLRFEEVRTSIWPYTVHRDGGVRALMQSAQSQFRRCYMLRRCSHEDGTTTYRADV